MIVRAVHSAGYHFGDLAWLTIPDINMLLGENDEYDPVVETDSDSAFTF